MQLHHTTSIGDLQVFFEIIFGFFDFLHRVQLEQKHCRYYFTDILMFFEIYFHFSHCFTSYAAVIHPYRLDIHRISQRA